MGLMAVCLLAVQPVFAQNKTVAGKVTDSKDGSGILGASVTVKGSKSGTQTDAAGAFSLSVPANATTIIISAIGFGQKEFAIGDGNIVAALESVTSNLNEVVVIGYGSARKKDLTGSVASVRAKDFNQGVIAAPDQLLQNKVAGLEVTSNSGQPGAATTIKIRGNSSIRAGNNPLYVVDGVPLDGGTARPGFGASFGGTPASNPLLYINPFDIAQIDVLKDASSAAIYGSRGSNGVIVITTKKGTSGASKLEIGANFGLFAGLLQKYKILDAGQYRSAITKYGLANTLDGGQNVDAMKEITQQKLTQNYSLAYSGGNENGKFRASFLGSTTQGLLKKTSLDKYLASFNGQYKFIDNKLSLDFGLIAGNVGEDATSISNNAGSTGNLISSALSWNPTVAFRQANGKYNFPSNGSGNPLALSDAYGDHSSTNTFLANISAAYKLLDNLEYKFVYGINHQSSRREVNTEGWLVGFPGLSGQGFAAIGNGLLTSQVFTHTLSYRADLTKKLSMEALGGYEYYKSNNSGDVITGSGYNTNLDETNRISIPYTKYFQNAKTQTPMSSGQAPTTEIQSYFARLNFNLSDKYLLTGTMRADGSSKFGKNNKYGYFPSVGAKWVVSNEAFLKSSTTLSNLAVRVSWGLTGNQEFPAGSSQEQFALSSYNTAGQVVNGNPDLKWETTHSINAGIDFGLKGGKIYGSVDYYNKKTKDILFQTTAIQPAPSSISFVNLPGAELNNSGVELALGASLVQHKNFDWDINLNVAYNKNIIKKFTDPLTGLPLRIQTGTIDGQGVSGTLGQVITNDQPVNEYYLKPFGGFDKDGKQIIGDNPQVAGDPNPHVIGGFSTSLRYRKFNFSLNTGGAFGFLIYNNTATSVTNISGIAAGRNIDQAAFNSEEKPASGVGASSRFLEKGDYWKLRNVTVRYNVGNVGKYVKNLSAFVSGTNLFVITKFTGFDPEVNTDKSSNAYPSRSIEYVPYPTPRSISFGLNFGL